MRKVSMLIIQHVGLAPSNRAKLDRRGIFIKGGAPSLILCLLFPKAGLYVPEARTWLYSARHCINIRNVTSGLHCGM